MMMKKTLIMMVLALVLCLAFGKHTHSHKKTHADDGNTPLKLILYRNSPQEMQT